MKGQVHPLIAVGSYPKPIGKSRQMKANTGLPRDFISQVVLGDVAMAELRRLCGPTAPQQPSDPLGLAGFHVVESDVLEPDQWIAYDRKGRIVAMGRASSVGIFAMRKP